MKKILKKILTKAKIIRKPGLDDIIYQPRWRWNNYIAVRQFGASHVRWFTEQRYMFYLREFPNLDNPRKFNEKIHWLNLNYSNPLITRCCDKLEMKNYVEERLGSGFTVPAIAVYEHAADIDFSSLPDRFAIKLNWGDGKEYSELVLDKSNANEYAIKTKMSNGIQPWNNVYYANFFRGYKDVKGRIFVEQYIEHEGTDLTDYKIHCFNGEPKFILVCEERSRGRKMFKTFLDLDWKVLPCRRNDGLVNNNAVKPGNFAEMLEIARKLCKPFPFVRIDLYNVNARIYVGEMTFHPGCGYESFYPEDWNVKVGDMLRLPERNITDKDWI